MLNMDLTGTLAHNISRLLKEYDISARELAQRANMPQKTLHNMLTAKHSCKLDSLEKISKTLFISPAAMITPHLPTNVLMSRRLSRFIDKYATLDAEQREKLEDFIETLGD
jgi:DNA-binding Xre family transcriptional regulator